MAALSWRMSQLAMRGWLEAADFDSKAMRWSHRPGAAALNVPGFAVQRLDTALWSLSQSSIHERLPAHLRDAHLAPRRVPDIEMRWFKDPQFALFERLIHAPCHLAQLCDQLRQDAERIERDLVASWWCGALTRTESIESQVQPALRAVHSR